jgi:hypothetical protein
VVSDVSMEYMALILSNSVECSMNHGPLNSWKMKVVHAFKTSETTHPAMRYHFTEHQNLGFQSCEKLKNLTVD